MYRYKVDRDEIEYILKKQVESLWGGGKIPINKRDNSDCFGTYVYDIVRSCFSKMQQW